MNNRPYSDNSETPAYEQEIAEFLQSEAAEHREISHDNHVPYLAKNPKRAKRRHHDSVASARQMDILASVARDSKDSQVERGRFRKSHALGCSVPNCSKCSNARRNSSISGLSKLTKQEQIAQLAMSSELEELCS